jgi:hypothetical protein
MIVFDSFDCARLNMGFTRARFDPEALRLFQEYKVRDFESEDLLERLGELETQVSVLLELMKRVLEIMDLRVLSLGESTQPWDLARGLRHQINTLEPTQSRLVYEFQMSDNDKTRAIGNMLVYEYALCPGIYRVMPAQKNKVVFPALSRDQFLRWCPVMSQRRIGRSKQRMVDVAFATPGVRRPINIQLFLAMFSDTYTANKTHCAVMLEYWCSVFGQQDKLANIKSLNYDDVGDSLIQILGVKQA